MINLSERLLKSSGMPIYEKFMVFRSPDIYIADDVKDYLENSSKIEYPLWKGFPIPERLFGKFVERAYITLYNVGLNFEISLEKNYDIFTISDDSGMFSAAWFNKKDISSTMRTFDEVKEEEGLKENDFVYKIILKYFKQYNTSFILDVTKTRNNRIVRAKDALDSLINPEPEYA